MAAAEEAGPVGFNLRLADRVAVDDGEMRSPYFGLGRRSSASGRQNRANIRDILGFHKQLGKSRMGDVRRLRSQRELAIGGELDLSGAAAGIRDRNAANL